MKSECQRVLAKNVGGFTGDINICHVTWLW